MRQAWTLWTIVASLGIVAASAYGASGYEDTAIKRLLGKDYDGAKLVAVQGGQLVTVQLKTRKTTPLKATTDDSALTGMTAPSWSPNGAEVLFALKGAALAAPAAGGAPRTVLPATAGARATMWWTDPGTKDVCVVYATSAGTFIQRPKADAPAKLSDTAAGAGISRDGTTLAQAGTTCFMVDVKKNKTYPINRGRPAVTGSMSPDDTYRLMMVAAPGTSLTIRNRYDREIWKLAKPRGATAWTAPRWSNHADFCTATVTVDGKPVIVLIKVSTKQTVLLRGFEGAWADSQLWLPSAANQTLRSPIDHLVLERLNDYKAKVARAKDYSPIIAELKANPDAEATLIVETLDKYGRDMLTRARYAVDAAKSQVIYRDMAARYARHPVGDAARRTLASPQFRSELTASPMAARFEALRARLHRPHGDTVRQNFYDETFMARNRPVLVAMVKLMSQLKRMHGGTRTYQQAKYHADQYGLPTSTSEPGNKTLSVIATVRAVSPIPTPVEILPEKDALLYVRYRVQRVVEGKYSNYELIGVHWAVRFGRATPAAKFAVGEQHVLKLDMLDAHPELAKTHASNAANNVDLAPYWALTTRVVR